MENRLHQLTVVSEHRGLAGVEAVGFRPAQPEAHLEIAMLRAFVS